MASTKIKEILKNDYLYFIIFLAIAAFITTYKLLVIYHFGPRWFYDSYDYYHYGEEILNGHLASPEAKRTPGYPLFIALSILIFGKGTAGISYLQILCGLVSLYLFYKIQIDLGLNKKLVFLNLVIFLVGPLSYFELNIFSESLTVLLTLLYFRYTQLYLKEKTKLTLVLSVVLAAAMILTRPQFIFPLLFTALFFFLKHYRKYSYWLAGSIVVLCLVYSGINYKFSNYFGISSFLGYNIINHTGEYIEKGKDFNPELVNIYLSKRDEFKKQNGGSQAFTIWVVNKEISKKMNYSFVALSNELTRISVLLVIQDPILYFKSYLSALYKSLLYNDDYMPDSYKLSYFSFLNLIILVGGTLLLLIMRSGNNFINFMKVTFFANFFFSGLIDIGENFRHIITLQFILIIAITSGVYIIYKKLRFEEAFTNNL